MTKTQSLVVILALTLLGFALRLYRIDNLSFRGDEAFTVLNWVSHPLVETLQSEIPLRDPQPPLTFAIFRIWALLFGTSEFSMRILPALFSLIGIPALYALGKHIGGTTLGILAALFWATHPFLIWHAQDAKAYAIWASFSATSLWLALRALEKQRRLDWILYVACATITAYLYYLELFALLALNLYVLIRYYRRWSILKQWGLAQIAIALMLAPWYLQERLLFSSGYGGTASEFQPGKLLTGMLPTLNLGASIPELWMNTLGPVIALILIAGLVALWHQNRRYALLIGLSVAIPILLLSLVSLRLNVFVPRYILSVIPAQIILLGSLILSISHQFKKPSNQRIVTAGLVALWLIPVSYSLSNHYFDPVFAKADWRALVSYLHSHATPDDLVVQVAADEAFTLYYDSYSDFDRLPANPDQSEEEIVDRLERGAATHDSIWLVARTPAEWPNGDYAPDWLTENMQEIRRTEIVGTPVQQFMPWEVAESEIQTSPLAEFDDLAELLALEVSAAPEPNKDLMVLVYWQPIGASDQALKTFIHLTGPENPASGTPLWSQDDQFPQNGRIKTSSWSTEAIYRDVFAIPLADVPPGTYELHIGLYNPDTGQRAALVSGEDNYLIGSVEVP